MKTLEGIMFDRPFDLEALRLRVRDGFEARAKVAGPSQGTGHLGQRPIWLYDGRPTTADVHQTYPGSDPPAQPGYNKA